MVRWGFGRQLFFGVWCRLGTRRDALPLFCALISDGSCCLIPNVLVFRPIFLLLWTSNKYSLSFCRVIWAAWLRQKQGCMAIRSWAVRVISPDMLFFGFTTLGFHSRAICENLLVCCLILCLRGIVHRDIRFGRGDFIESEITFWISKWV